MKRIVSAIVVAGLAACQAPGPITIPGITRAPQNAEDALDAYYRTLPEEFYPTAAFERLCPVARAGWLLS